MDLSFSENIFLHFYKGDFEYLENIDKIYPDIVNYPAQNYSLFYSMFPNIEKGKTFCEMSLNNENINAFLNFLNNPVSNDFYRKIDISFFDGIIDMIKALIDISCKYALNNPDSCILYRVENKYNIDSLYNGFLGSFRSTSYKSFDSGELDCFMNENSINTVYKFDGFCPRIDVDRLISSRMGDEKEVLFPPFLDCYFDDNNVINVSFNDNNSNLDDLNFFEILVSLEKENFGKCFIEFQRTGIITHEFMKLINYFKDYFKLYAKNKYKEYSDYYYNNYESQKSF